MFNPTTQANRRRVVKTTSTSVTLDATVGTLLCEVSSDGSVTVPSAAQNPDVDFIIKNIGSNSAKVTLNRSGSDTIDGATSYVLYMHGDWARIQSDAASGWWVTGGHLKPHLVILERQAAQSIGDGIQTRVAFDTAVANIGGMADLTNGRGAVKRTGSYIPTASYFWWYPPATTTNVQISIYVNGAFRDSGTLYTGAMDAVRPKYGEPIALTAGDYVDLYVLQVSGAARNTITTAGSRPTLKLIEVR